MRRGPINIESLEGLREIIQRFLKAHEDNDVETQRDILREFIKNAQDGHERKHELLGRLNGVMQQVDAVTSVEERISCLAVAFRFAADLRSIGYEELDDQETGDKATDAAIEAAQKLKAIYPEGSEALVGLLNDPNVSIRGFAAVQLLDEMPKQAIPVIEEIQRTARGTDAALAAGFALSMYRSEIERKS